MSDIKIIKWGNLFSEPLEADKGVLVVPEGSGSESDRNELIQALRGPTTEITSTSHTVTNADSTILVDDDTAGGAVTLTLLDAATAGDNYILNIKKLGTTGNVIISSSDNIDGATTATLTSQYAAVTLISDGSTYHIF